MSHESPLKVRKFNKWPDVAPGATVGEAARVAVEQRMAPVIYFLDLAAFRSEESSEYVHQLRVATRRAIAALQLCAPVLPRRRSKWLTRQLKRLRTAAGNARDLDVLALRKSQSAGVCGEGDLSGEIRRQRVQAQQLIVTARHGLSRHRFERRVASLLRRVGSGRREAVGAQPFDVWARKKLRPVVRRFFKASNRNRHDLSRLHRFRIRGKQLRYVMELLAPAFPAEFRDDAYGTVEQLQDHLGGVNDHAVALVQIEDWVLQAVDQRYIEGLRRQQVQEESELHQSMNAYVDWWTPQREGELRERLHELLRCASLSEEQAAAALLAVAGP